MILELAHCVALPIVLADGALDSATIGPRPRSFVDVYGDGSHAIETGARAVLPTLSRVAAALPYLPYVKAIEEDCKASSCPSLLGQQ